ADLLRGLSVTERAARIPLEFREALARQLERSGAGAHIAARNPGEVFRQYVACMLRRLDAPLACAEHGGVAPEPAGCCTAREAIGSFILSMTHDAADVLGAYLLAKEAGLFADAAGTECCTLPVVPLFESVDDLRRAPEIVRELLRVPLIRRSVRAQGGVYEV